MILINCFKECLTDKSALMLFFQQGTFLEVLISNHDMPSAEDELTLIPTSDLSGKNVQ